jgi:hypothetical protein
MSAPWFSPEAAHWFAGLGMLSLTAAAVPAIKRGQYRALVVSVWRGITLFGLLMLAAGVLAWRDRQPDHVVLPLVLAGGLIAAGYAFSLVFILKGYRLAEQRKVAAREL